MSRSAAKKSLPRSAPAAPAARELQRPGRPGGRRDTNRRERTDALLSAALPLFLERGIEEVTIDEITRAANMAKGGFYRYFTDKAALVEALFAPLAAELEEAMNDSGAALSQAESTEAMLGIYRDFAARVAVMFMPHGNLIRLYLQESRAPARGARRAVRTLSERVTRHALEMTRQAQSRGMLRPIPPEITALAVIGAVERLLLAVLSDEYEGEMMEIPGGMLTLFLDGLRPREDDAG